MCNAIHLIIKPTTRSSGMQTYKNINANNAHTAKADCLNDIGKLHNKSVCGKSTEDYSNIKLLPDEEHSYKLPSKLTFESCTIFFFSFLPPDTEQNKYHLEKTSRQWRNISGFTDDSDLSIFRGRKKPKNDEKPEYAHSDTDCFF